MKDSQENDNASGVAFEPLVSRCPDCGYAPCACELLERVRGAERRETGAIVEAAKFRALWECSASCLTHNAQKIKPRGEDERRILEAAKASLHGQFWSGRTNGWLPEADQMNLFG